MTTPRSEYPRPQFVRDSWQCLNGSWDFEIDYGNSGESRGLVKPEAVYAQTITVPFCPESSLSGIGNTDFLNAVWYRKTISVTEEHLSGRVILHFGAVDYEATIWVNETRCGEHKGGYSSFELDITDCLQPGENRLVVRAVDDTRDDRYPSGKQSGLYESHGCFYTRTTGIWQTVWLEFTSRSYLKSVRVTADPATGTVCFEPSVKGCDDSLTLTAQVSYKGEDVAQKRIPVDEGNFTFSMEIEHPKLWNPGAPELYDVTYSLESDGRVLDTVKSYFGFRNIMLKGRAICLNGKPVYQRLVLDQGFYPDGIYTAPSDEALKKDIELSMSLGFNGARLHQKIFEERFLYWADQLGYLVWGEHGNWGMDIANPETALNFLPEWLEALERDYNHPSIVCWCPFNETWDHRGRQQDNRIIANVYLATKAFDRTRPVIDTSGNFHVMTDIYDIHNYDQSVELFQERYGAVTETQGYDNFPDRQHFNGAPYFLSEYGGASWAGTEKNAWGYGENPKTEEEFAQRYQGLTRALMDNKNICGFCYTQLYDVEQEQNGLFTYERTEKFSPDVYKVILETNAAKAAIEE